MSKIIINNNYLTQISNLQKDIKKLKDDKKAQIRNKYQSSYDFYKKDSFFALGVSVLMLLFGISNQKKDHSFLGLTILGTLGILGYPFYKPKKEKYDAAMQKELDEIV